ncbi:MAG: hypothetical protein WA655_04315 [Candidatus Korobacteraceae bacterium]
MRCTRMLLAGLAVIVFAGAGAIAATAQQTWWVQSADYGIGNQRQDVTNTVKRLVNGPDFKVTNANLGGDPAKGKDKTLRIVARNSSGKVRDFYYKEGATVNSRMFTGGPGSGYPGWGGEGKPGWGGPGYGNSVLRITSAKWGFGAAQQNVTGRLQGMVRNNRLSVKVNPQTMGGDPVPGNSKMVTVFYTYSGKSSSKVVPEGQMLNLP